MLVCALNFALAHNSCSPKSALSRRWQLSFSFGSNTRTQQLVPLLFWQQLSALWFLFRSLSLSLLFVYAYLCFKLPRVSPPVPESNEPATELAPCHRHCCCWCWCWCAVYDSHSHGFLCAGVLCVTGKRLEVNNRAHSLTH